VHLVAARLRRELDDPVRRARIELDVLKGVTAGPDEARACDELGATIEEISQISRRLAEIRSAPPA
jgi:hypothetical protein